jgi:DNA-binding MarR family transcriptional regulator
LSSQSSTADAAPAPAAGERGNLELASRLRLVVTRLSRQLRRAADAGATASQLSALASVEALGPITLGELAAVEWVQPPSMTKIVARLEADGMVAREVDEGDRRVVRVRVTPEGRRALQRSRRAKNEQLARKLALLGPDELAALGRALEVLERLVEGP